MAEPDMQNCSRVFFLNDFLFLLTLLKFQTLLTLSSHNSVLKNYSNKNHHIFRKPWTSAFRWHTPDTSEKCSNLRKKRLRLHSFGPFWTISTGYQWEINEFGRFSCFGDFFVWFHIVCDIYTSYYAHFTFSDTIWPLSLSSDFGTRSCTHTDTASYLLFSLWWSPLPPPSSNPSSLRQPWV